MPLEGNNTHGFGEGGYFKKRKNKINSRKQLQMIKRGIFEFH